MGTRASERKRANSEEGGFSLIELLTVAAIIVIMSAIAAPSVSKYIRNYRITGATRIVASEIQTARLKAVGKNVKVGVIFAVTDSTHCRYVIEDDIRPGVAGKDRWVTPDWDDLVSTANEAVQAGTTRVLPRGVEFTTCNFSSTTGVTFDFGMKFRNLGNHCQFDAAVCKKPGATLPTTAFIGNSSSGACVAVIETATNQRREIRVTSGGRIAVM